MNVLVLAPHPDDETLGCGGTIARHADAGDSVHVCFLTSGELALGHLPADEARRLREAEAGQAAEVLGVGSISFLRRPDWSVGDDIGPAVDEVVALIEKSTPERLYFPHAAEWHPDHRAAAAIADEALARGNGSSPEPFAYEVWTPIQEFHMVEDISDLMERKLRAFECYPSQHGEFDYERATRGLNGYRGALAARTEYAEVFQLPRLVDAK